MKYLHKTHPRAKRLTMRLNKKGEIVITTPKWTPKKLIEKFVRSNHDWITTQQKNLAKRKNFADNPNSILIFGKKYKKLKKKIESASKITIRENNFEIRLLDSLKKTQTKEQKLIDDFLKNTAEKYIIPRTHQLAKKMKISFKRISLRQQSTRWGSCSSKGNLNFNWRLAHFAPKIIDYVIVHELAHRTHMDHSKDFWRLVEKHNPEFRLHRGWLKRNGVGLG